MKGCFLKNSLSYIHGGNSMNLKCFLKSVFQQSCIGFTLISFLFLLISLAVNSSILPALTIYGAAEILFFSFILSLCNCLFFIKKLSFSVKLLIHFFAIYIDFILLMLLSQNFSSKRVLILSVCFIVLYWIIALIYIAFFRKRKKTAEASKTYKNIYKKD